jgi:hypothetical protein
MNSHRKVLITSPQAIDASVTYRNPPTLGCSPFANQLATVGEWKANPLTTMNPGITYAISIPNCRSFRTGAAIQHE